jgi:hypothetical protein
LAVLAQRWSRRRQWLVTGIPLILIFLLPWFLALHLGVGGALLDLLALGLPFLVLVLLYWMRWWAISPPRTWIEAVTGKSE